MFARPRLVALTVTVCMIAGALIASPALAARTTAEPDWSSPDPGTTWSFNIRVLNTASTSLRIDGLTLWANWGGAPTEAAPAHPSTPLPKTIAVGVYVDLHFSIVVPASAANGHYRISAALTAASANASASGGFDPPLTGTYPGWDISVTSGPGAAATNSIIGAVVLVGLIALSVGLRVMRMRRRAARNAAQPMQPAYAPGYAPPYGQAPAGQYPQAGYAPPPPYPPQPPQPPQYP
jgi:hypothetical protein